MNKKILTFGILLLFLSTSTPFAYGDEETALQQKEKELQKIEAEFENYKAQKEDEDKEYIEKIEEGNERIEDIKARMEEELINFSDQKKLEEEAEKQLEEVRGQILTLEGQLKALDISLESSEKELEAINIQILKRVADLTALTEESERLNSEKEIQKKAVLGLFQMLQSENEEFGIADESKNMLHLFLSDESFSKNFWREQHISSMEKVSRDIFHRLEESERKIEEVSQIIVRENKKLNSLHDQKKKEENILSEQIAAKRILVKRSKANEVEFEELLEESRKEMKESASVITDLQNDRRIIDEKLKKIATEQEEAQKKLESEEDARYAIGEEFLKEEEEETLLSWPVDPKKGISAHFQDAEYKKTFKMEHNAIDIPTPQGTKIKAPALGYVYKVTDNGMGYSSIIIAHQNNLMTVYGHVSKILVEEGELIQEGETIGLSGGTPGTKGAGWMTTGAHLHFEVFENGIAKDPLLYLPLEKLSPDIQQLTPAG